MSYDYNAILSDIQRSRVDLYISNVSSDNETSRAEKLQQLVDLFADFSGKCPMTPLLWAQYAYDSGELMQHLLEDENESDGAIQSNFETQRSILELAIIEFPGCALLRRFHFEMLCRLKSVSELDKYALERQVREAYHDAWSMVGRGSHRNVDDVHVVAIHQLYVAFLALSISKPEERKELILESFLERAQTPMKMGNDSIMDDISQLASLHNISFTDDDLRKIESVRRLEAKHFGLLEMLEENVEAVMSEEGLSPPAQLQQYFSDTDSNGFIDWAHLLRPSQDDTSATNYLMGAGMMSTSQAFQKYTKALMNQEERFGMKSWKLKQSKHSRIEEMEDETVSREVIKIISSLVVPVYERAVSECPTVEDLWIDYIKHLMSKLDQESTMSVESSSFIESVRRFTQVTARSVRNCPYSVKLYGYRMKAVDYEAQAGIHVLNAENVLNIVDEGIKAKFIAPQQGLLELYLSATQVFKERILTLISRTTASKKFDESEALENNFKKVKNMDGDSDVRLTILLDHLLNKYGGSLGDQVTEDICDLIDDLRETFNTASNYLKCNFPKWSIGKSILLFERATVEASIIAPILISLKEEEDVEDPILFFEQAVRVHLPPRPLYWRSYINFLWSETFYHVYSIKLSGVMGSGITVGTRLRFIRSLFHRALQSTSKVKVSVISVDEQDLYTLCRDFVQFENTYGSDYSREYATKLVALKTNISYSGEDTVLKSNPMPILSPSIIYSDEECADRKRKLEGDENLENEQKRMKVTCATPSHPTTTQGSGGDLAQMKEGTFNAKHKVRIGNLDYPAHPYTVKVTNLSPDTEDMDLVDFFRRFGPIVHARILREKHHHGQGKSKGTGLVQFEQHSSVALALEMSGQLGLNEKLIIIERSHQPAISVVPPGMHRKSPAGEGKYIKRKEKRNEQKKATAEDSGQTDGVESENKHELKASLEISTQNTAHVTKSISGGALRFIPRAVVPSRKKAISLK